MTYQFYTVKVSKEEKMRRVSMVSLQMTLGKKLKEENLLNVIFVANLGPPYPVTGT